MSHSDQTAPHCMICGRPRPLKTAQSCSDFKPPRITVDVPVMTGEGEVIGRLTIPVEMATNVAILGIEDIGVQLHTTIMNQPDKLPELVSVMVRPIPVAADNMGNKDGGG